MSEIDRQLSKVMPTVVDIPVTADIKWILSPTMPQDPAGYTRAVELDLDLGIAGKWWAFIKVT